MLTLSAVMSPPETVLNNLIVPVESPVKFSFGVMFLVPPAVVLIILSLIRITPLFSAFSVVIVVLEPAVVLVL